MRLHKAENTAVHIGRKLPGQHRKCFFMPFGSIGRRQQHGIVALHYARLSYRLRKHFQRFDALVDRRDVGLKIFAVCRYRILKIGTVGGQNALEVGEKGPIVLGTKYHGVHLVRLQQIARDAIGKEGVARIHISLAKAFVQPLRIAVHDVRPCADADDHAKSISHCARVCQYRRGGRSARHAAA